MIIVQICWNMQLGILIMMIVMMMRILKTQIVMMMLISVSVIDYCSNLQLGAKQEVISIIVMLMRISITQIVLMIMLMIIMECLLTSQQFDQTVPT